jgi:cytochrome c biogenesis protein CcmG/thiol:disulfide interchange protein DsbE
LTLGRFRIRWIALAVAVVLVAFTVVLAVQTRSQPSIPRLVQEHATAPHLDLKTLDGKAVTSAQLRSKTYVVNFFNSWCIPCQQEAPALKTFYEQHKSESDFEMLGIITDDDAATMRGYVRDQGIAWPVLVDPKGTASLDYGTTGQPETYVIAPDGVVVCGTLGRSSVEALNAWLAAARGGQECT